MRKFFIFLSVFYLSASVGLSYRLIYNEYYVQIHDEVEVSSTEGQVVYPFGEIVGIYTECDGVFVIDTCEIETKENTFVNPAKDILQTGDYILEVNGEILDEKEVLVQGVSVKVSH